MARDGLILDILRLAERLGIAFDSPTLLVERERPEAARKDRGDADLPSAV
jgi:hypothetical protein